MISKNRNDIDKHSLLGFIYTEMKEVQSYQVQWIFGRKQTGGGAIRAMLIMNFLLRTPSFSDGLQIPARLTNSQRVGFTLVVNN